MGSLSPPARATSDAPSVLSPTRQRSPTPAAISRARWRRCVIVKDFSVNPNDRLVLSFEQAHALRGLDTLAASIDQSHTDNIVGLRKEEQKTLGFDDSSGLRKNLQVAANAVERIINENMSGLAEADATRLLVALLSMRHFEADYRVNQSEVSRQQFLMAYKKFCSAVSEELLHSTQAIARTAGENLCGHFREMGRSL